MHVLDITRAAQVKQPFFSSLFCGSKPNLVSSPNHEIGSKQHSSPPQFVPFVCRRSFDSKLDSAILQNARKVNLDNSLCLIGIVFLNNSTCVIDYRVESVRKTHRPGLHDYRIGRSFDGHKDSDEIKGAALQASVPSGIEVVVFGMELGKLSGCEKSERVGSNKPLVIVEGGFVANNVESYPD